MGMRKKNKNVVFVFHSLGSLPPPISFFFSHRSVGIGIRLRPRQRVGVQQDCVNNNDNGSAKRQKMARASYQCRCMNKGLNPSLIVSLLTQDRGLRERKQINAVCFFIRVADAFPSSPTFSLGEVHGIACIRLTVTGVQKGPTRAYLFCRHCAASRCMSMVVLPPTLSDIIHTPTHPILPLVRKAFVPSPSRR